MSSQVIDDIDDSITSVELFIVSLPFDAARREAKHSKDESIDSYNASSRTFTHMQSLLVKVNTADGFSGWGEGFGHKSNPATWAALEEVVAPFFLGRSSVPEQIMPEAEYAFHAFGRTGPVHYALSAMDIALWDVAAQRAGKTLREFISPQARDEISAYASLVHYAEDPGEVAFHLTRAAQQGFNAFKLHESTAPAIAAAREAVGSRPLMVDVNCKWTTEQATRALAQLEELSLLWIEEPVFPPDDSQALRELNTRFGNVSGGENHSGLQGLLQDIRSGALAFAQPSIGKIGGISAMLQLRKATKDIDTHVVPHCFYYGPALLATAQIIALDPELPLPDGQTRPELEVPFLRWPEVLHPWHAPHQGLMDETGRLPLPTQAGLGFDPDLDVLHRHLDKHVVLTAG
ncbi:mandelate racemase/muconate lactonizing enzyme family protein [Glutamicibacter sp. NPDC087344]|uniref:mandelate racemase/muconate lactonizing enzyme family protein n=1 Tax=Glutamicibacter sp. NPDC087344 TaxID=3363994 RepID=UPI00382894B7